MKILVKLPVMVRVDNIEAIFLASNITTISCTKHIDARYKYVHEYMEDGVLNIIFVKSAENDSNVLTKMLSAELHKKNSKNDRQEAQMIPYFLKIVEVNRKGARDEILSSNI